MWRKLGLLSFTSDISSCYNRARRSKSNRNVGFNEAEITAQTNPVVETVIVPNTNPNEEENQEFKANYNWTIWHEWFAKDDIRQKYVQYAYKLWWLDLVTLMECENGNWNINAKWDSWKAIWLCQMNTNYHKLPAEYYTTWQTQVELCYKKWKSGTKFYWPNRMIKWKRCSELVKSRFTVIE